MEPVGSLYDVLVTWPVVNTASYAQCYTYTHTGNTNNRLPLIIYSTCGAQTESNNWRLLANTTLHNACASFRAAAYTQFGAMKSKHCNKSCTRRYAAAATEIHKSSSNAWNRHDILSCTHRIGSSAAAQAAGKFCTTRTTPQRRQRWPPDPSAADPAATLKSSRICICCGSRILGAFGNKKTRLNIRTRQHGDACCLTYTPVGEAGRRRRREWSQRGGSRPNRAARAAGSSPVFSTSLVPSGGTGHTMSSDFRPTNQVASAIVTVRPKCWLMRATHKHAFIEPLGDVKLE